VAVGLVLFLVDVVVDASGDFFPLERYLPEPAHERGGRKLPLIRLFVVALLEEAVFVLQGLDCGVPYLVIVLWHRWPNLFPWREREVGHLVQVRLRQLEYIPVRFVPLRLEYPLPIVVLAVRVDLEILGLVRWMLPSLLDQPLLAIVEHGLPDPLAAPFGDEVRVMDVYPGLPQPLAPGHLAEAYQLAVHLRHNYVLERVHVRGRLEVAPQVLLLCHHVDEVGLEAVVQDPYHR